MRVEAEVDEEDALSMLLPLAGRFEPPWVDLHLRDGRIRSGDLRKVDEIEVHIQDEGGDEPWGEHHSWIEIAKVVIT